jgi:EAL domain-containing protein (putative c-di-GMP-specific phosphodiesterase class I)
MAGVVKRKITLAEKKTPEDKSRQRESDDAVTMMADGALEEEPLPTVIPALPDVMRQAGSLLSRNRSLAVLYINCSRINKIENLCGKKTYLDIMGKIQDVITGMKGNQIRQDDLVVANNTGSDEFTIFLSGKRTELDYCPSDLESLCERMTAYLNQSVFPITFPYLRGNPKISIGYAVVLHNPLMREERLLNKVVEDAKTMSNFFEFKRVMRYKEKLQELILKESIRTIFQPIVDFSRNEILGYEALSRGPADTEFENPYILFDAAAESDLLFELDRLCRKKSLQNAKGLKNAHRLFVNCLPSMVLDPEFRDTYLKSLLEDLRLNTFNIVFEITEREAIENYELFNKAVQYYKDLGFAIAVDDTGSGFSSLETVVELKPHYIKLDLSLVRGIEKNLLKQELIKAIQSLAVKMDSLVIAEGIETEEELNALRQIGVTVGQGYYFAKPGPAFPLLR